MSRIRISLLAALFLCVFSRPLFSATNEFLSVQVKQGQLRSTPSFLGSVTATLAYGDKVELIEDKGAVGRGRGFVQFLQVRFLSRKVDFL